MTDTLTQQQRSNCMSHIRSKWTSVEIIVHNHLKGKKIRHEMHPDINGHPDVLLTGKRTAVFIHGCFWHKCNLHCRLPASNRDYWLKKLELNAKRDEKNLNDLKKAGYKVVTIWEHELRKDLTKSMLKLC